ncbi:MAG: hypothetical protein WC884_02925 [Candidatus Paceibacterota bacterium]
MENLQNQNTNITNEPNKLKKSTLIKVLVLILAFLVLGSFFFIKFPMQKSGPVTVDTLPVGYKFTVMEAEQYPIGFPKSLIVKDGIWQRGEDTTTGDGKNLKIVELIYKKIEPATLVLSFEKTFKNNTWLIDSTQNSILPVVRVFNKTKEGKSEVATLIIIKVNEVDSLVNITIATQ